MSNIKSIIRLAEYPFEENARYVKIDNDIYMMEQDLDNYLNLVGLNKNELMLENDIFTVVDEENSTWKNDIAYSILYELKASEFENIESVNYANRSFISKLIGALLRKKSYLKLDNYAKIDNFYKPMIKECDDAINKIDKELYLIEKNETTANTFSSDFISRLNSGLLGVAVSLLTKNYIVLALSGVTILNNTIMLVWSYTDYKSVLNHYKKNIMNAKQKLLAERAKDLEKLKGDGE